MKAEIKRGQAISFRVPSDTPDHLLKQLQKLKETERRNFSSCIAEYVMRGVSQSVKKEQETITIPLPKKLSKSQRDWLKHEHSEAVLGSIIYQLLTDPVRATALLASLNSNALDIDEALYLQEDKQEEANSLDLMEEEEHHEATQEIAIADEGTSDDINDFDWQDIEHSDATENEEVEDDLDNLLGDFLSKMNK
ncbi:hypothetical protein JOD43_002406 [Pullulanibacillus pueri]|uniref:Uncharacterized protein n=1 Tax=Pullulanibacillus pueri TaxID=1437324 RepID=A0A8J3ELU8_9BACL|nr:hypothetical protein [Pullulanibacillus pueri]MBM7682233.1 hypothetical protein [Pullulanibacillus pueri]GGH80549.1 hypothetical protein GCM10007096_17130 [Pullulanibacillus pueri]